MNSSTVIGNLEDILKSLERERESLKHVLLSGKISRETFDLLEKRIDKTASVASELKKALREEESFLKENLLKGMRLFETLLVEFEHKRLLGEIGKKEYQHNSEIISTGLDSIRKQIEENTTNSKYYIKSKNELKNSSLRKSENSTRRNKKITPKDESQDLSKVHCMNPWNPECRNTDIEVSIYYDGRMIPICHQCWKEIANKDVEWSSLQ